VRCGQEDGPESQGYRIGDNRGRLL
jgi:hypothetical protein